MAVPAAPVVLLVDDDAEFLDDLRALLRGSLPTVAVEVATTGRDALARLDRGGIAAVVADQQMPGMDGIEFLTRAQAAHPGVPRIMLTGYPGFDLAMSAVDGLHCLDFVPKPPEPARLMAAIRRALIDHSIASA